MRKPAPGLTGDSTFPVRTAVYLCLVFALIVALLRFPFTLDDAYITFHYVRNYAQGFTLGTWNVGEPPVEGFTSLLWTLMLGWGEKLHLSPFYLSKLLGFVCAGAMPLAALAAWRASYKRLGDFPVPPAVFACAAILLSLYVPLFFYSVTGMETTFFSLQVLLLLLLPVFAGGPLKTAAAVLLSITLTLTRPEGIMVLVLVQAYVLATHRRKPPMWAIAGLVCGVLAFAGLTLYRLHEFHVPLPNTYYAKATGGSAVHRFVLGGHYVLRFLVMVAPAAVALLAMLVAARRSVLSNKYIVGLLMLVAIYGLYVLKVGGDPDAAFPLRRHFVHLAGALALLLGGAIAFATSSFRQACRAALAIAVALAVWISVGWCREPFRSGVQLEQRIGLLQLQPEKPLWYWLSRYSSPSTLTAVLGAGEWPYEVPGRFIDMLGLNDSYIAHHGKVDPHSKMQDSKTDMAYVLDRRPDIIEGYMEPSKLLQGECPAALHQDRAQMLHDLLQNPIFQSDYDFVVNGPYKMMNQALFVRKAYLQAMPDSGLKGVPVTQLVLYTKPCA